MMMLIGLTILFTYISLKDITDVFSKGYSYQHHFIQKQAEDSDFNGDK